jgi:hypothetical protein
MGAHQIATRSAQPAGPGSPWPVLNTAKPDRNRAFVLFQQAWAQVGSIHAGQSCHLKAAVLGT